jgi:hypothetical protein
MTAGAVSLLRERAEGGRTQHPSTIEVVSRKEYRPVLVHVTPFGSSRHLRASVAEARDRYRRLMPFTFSANFVGRALLNGSCFLGTAEHITISDSQDTCLDGKRNSKANSEGNCPNTANDAGDY